ncbi:nucleoside phosphatase family-domain-containing protein [Zopfochytrium polystomum]|nr:nucleoside phosphatase family-domain-containing protein [Zopfochytrium polystomum]
MVLAPASPFVHSSNPHTRRRSINNDQTYLHRLSMPSSSSPPSPSPSTKTHHQYVPFSQSGSSGVTSTSKIMGVLWAIVLLPVRKPQVLLLPLLAIVGLLYFAQMRSISAPNGSQDSKSKPSADLRSVENCKPPADRPPLQYALMIDAGSTGSRIHVYKFHYCTGSSPTLVDEVFEQIKPGLSAYGDAPEEAAKSLDKLLNTASETVPKNLQRCTPVAVKATAGLRLLGTEKSEAILAAVRRRLEEHYPFKVVEDNGVSVMDGEDEGVFAWITVNYLLGKIGGNERKQTAAIMDLGGGSTQIVFEPLPTTIIASNEHRTELLFGGHTYVLYQHSYLGYGLMEARKRLLEQAVKDAKAHEAALHEKGSPPAFPISPTLPCLPRGKSIADPSTASAASSAVSQVVGTGAGFPTCSQYVARHLFDKSHLSCAMPPCSWDGVYQPRLRSAFPEGLEIYAFSYIYDRTAELGALVENGDGDGGVFTPDAVRALGEKVCEVDGELPASAPANFAALGKAVEKDPALCLDVGYIYHLLATGYEIPGARKLRSAKKIRGVETGWCLGATIHVLDQLMAKGGSCREN